ncbi:probable calcium-binding protein CML27 [Herrania umbratica]|uniref:Probable calcium-binding protein CML27 n=1 Tax=Herrania umbratica TaxID=108875 RepID=A0A6J1AZC3_9ROSI|nr:probable calcium-binding protein CML27 [Herrania umbratica]
MSMTTPSPQPNTSSVYLENMDELQKVFNQFDANKDGKISVSELGDVLKAMGSSYTKEELERVMEDIDTDKDGFINLSEFSALCRSSSDAVSAASELRDAFDLYDQDKNGLISANELHLVLNRLGMNCSVDDCVRMITSVDSDGDGNVNFEEFEKMMSASAPRIDNGSKP